jgi:magnesium-transporting ATPase (P-type)
MKGIEMMPTTVIISITIITIIFSIKLYQTYKTHSAKNISYSILISILIFSIVFASALLLILIRELYQTEFSWKLRLETINILLFITIYFIVGTLYIIYIKRLYKEAEAIEKELEEKGIIDIDKVVAE